MKKIFTLLFLVALSLGIYADQQVSGVVLYENGEPVVGATIQAKDDTHGTISDYDGKFEMSVPESVKTLVVKFMGMATQEVAAGKNLRIVMQENAEIIQEVVVTGFGNVSKGSYAGSAQAVKAEDIEKKNPSEISKALAGEVAGVQVINGSGQPGTNATIRIRGIGSLNGSSAPLYVVDGVTYDGDISSIDPGDIASTTILKDATATSLYGARGANGVIVITTKKGTSGDEGHIDVDVKYGANMRLLPLYDVITSPEEYVGLAWLSIYNAYHIEKGNKAADAAKSAGIDLFSPSGIPAGYNLWQAQGKNLIDYDIASNKLKAYGFDTRIPRAAGYENLESWRDAIFRIGQKLDANVKIHGGTEKVKYFTSFGYLKDEGYYQASDFNRFSVRSNVDFEPKKWLKGNVNLAYTYYTMNNPDQDGDGAMNNGFYYVNAIPSIYPVYLRDETGNIPIDPRTGQLTYDYGNELGRSFGLGINPAGSLRLDKENRVQHEVDAKTSLEFKLYKGLKFTVNAGLHYYSNRYSQLTNPYYGDAEGIGRILQQNTNLFTVSAQEMLEYNGTFGDHTVRVMAGHENYLYLVNQAYGYKSYLADGGSLELSNAIKMNAVEGNSSRFALDAYFATAMYTYKERYTITANYRADGSSRYAKGHRWGHFGSIGAAWTFTNEDFIENSDAKDWLKDGKLRLSWGVLGNQINSLYSYTNMYGIVNSNDRIGFIEGSLGNSEITWERSNTVDLGLELSISKYLDIEFDYFYKLTDNMLFSQIMAPSTAKGSIPTNDAKMVNQGVEFMLKAHAIDTRNIKLDIMLNGAHYTNYMLQMPEDYPGHRMTMNGAMSVGHSLYDHYNVEYLGVDDKGNSLFEAYYDTRYGAYMADKGNNEYNYITSLHQWILDQKNAGVDNPEQYLATTTTNDLTTATSKYLNKSYLPTLSGGIGFDLEVYGVTLSATCSYQLGGYGYDYTYMALMSNEQVGSHNWHVDIRNSWSELNPDSNIPRLSNGAGEYDQYAGAATSRYLTSNSYLSLNNVQLGYNFPKKWIEKIKLNKLNLYVSANNLAIATARRGYNPMTSFTGSSDTHAYSPLSTIMGGVKFSF
ncbi:MAG: SusC/RagA family TonB-linked outer membrane protein [Paludibacteraceae bacterium]|nr:SusC/RagA family TonB-linked outer membrane protein [Paludibacteraceae bacterium]MBQ2190567.1 SusC/RagA family TonB-linked outer membrane protein [Paludibacteraceae bacterium]